MQLFDRIKIAGLLLIALTSCTSDNASLSVNGGQGGSLARFAIQGDYLYVASTASVSVFSIHESGFDFVSKVNVGFGVETIVSRGTYLYLGAMDAMYIYSISDPGNPAFVFRYSHIVSCDPVVVEGNRAYVTLSSGSQCNRGTNALEIIDISDPYNPWLLSNYPMASPRGLGINNGILIICEQEYGIKMFDAKDPLQIKLLDQISNIHANDVIMQNGIATVTGLNGIYQYSYLENKKLQVISIIPVSK
jgi:hypothetical protein